MSDVLLCAECGRGLRPGQAGTWREFIALEPAAISKSRALVAKRLTGRVFCGECALPPPAGTLWDPDLAPSPVGSKPLVGAAG